MSIAQRDNRGETPGGGFLYAESKERVIEVDTPSAKGLKATRGRRPKAIGIALSSGNFRGERK